MTGEGINLKLPAFQTFGERSRVFALWDQTIAGTQAQEQVSYGRMYSKEEIQELVDNAEEGATLPGWDESGHGNMLASIACGSKLLQMNFTGAAPDAELLVVKLRPAKAYLRDYYYIPEGAEAYAETDLMQAIAFVDKIANEQERPLVILLGLGSNTGNHAGNGLLCDYLDSIAVKQHHCAVVAVGNEANQRHHFRGKTNSVLVPQEVEINVEESGLGFCAQLWGTPPDRFSVEVISPTGERMERIMPINGSRQRRRFVFEETNLTVDYRDVGRKQRSPLVFMRFTNVVRGIWKLRVYPDQAPNGLFDIWLPMESLLAQPVYFLSPNPDTTITEPSDALYPIAVGSYRTDSGGVDLDSGRGFTVNGTVKPELIAPGTEISAIGTRGNLVTASGTSVAAALTAGAAAQVLQWAVTDGNARGIQTIDIKNVLIRGARKSDGLYPNVLEGWGKLDVYQAFFEIR